METTGYLSSICKSSNVMTLTYQRPAQRRFLSVQCSATEPDVDRTIVKLVTVNFLYRKLFFSLSMLRACLHISTAFDLKSFLPFASQSFPVCPASLALHMLCVHLHLAHISLRVKDGAVLVLPPTYSMCHILFSTTLISVVQRALEFCCLTFKQAAFRFVLSAGALVLTCCCPCSFLI